MKLDTLTALTKSWNEAPSETVRILTDDYYKRPWGSLDLSINNTPLLNWDLSDTTRTDRMIFSALERASCQVGYGGYGEERPFYQQSEHFLTPNGPRSVHLGVDLFVKAGSEVVCPWEGIIHSFKDNKNYLDYGPTIILQHSTVGITWYSLYGHLSRKSLKNLALGRKIYAGEPFTEVGVVSENGGWTPHLHFQIILDLNGWYGDYPGVSTNEEKEKYLSNSPDPSVLLRPPIGGSITLL